MNNSAKKDNSWFKVFRNIQSHWIWEDKPFSKGQAWIDLILLAKHQDGRFTDRRGNFVDGERGCVYWSIRALAERWGWSRDKTKNFLKMLESDDMIEVFTKKASEKTMIRIENYGKYQSSATSKKASQKPVADQSPASQKPVADQSPASQKPVADIYKKDKKDKECKKKEKEEPAALSPPETVPGNTSGEAGYTDEDGETWYTGDELLAMSEEEIQALMKQGEEQGEKDGAV